MATKPRSQGRKTRSDEKSKKAQWPARVLAEQHIALREAYRKRVERMLRDVRAFVDRKRKDKQSVPPLPPKSADFEASIDFVGRSLLGVRSYLSQAVEVPARHAELGLVTVPRHADGTPFDWSEVTGGLFRVESGDSRPERAFAAVRYRGPWFWIDDADLESKTTFGLLTQLFNLQAGQVDLPAPALTLSVN